MEYLHGLSTFISLLTYLLALNSDKVINCTNYYRVCELANMSNLF